MIRTIFKKLGKFKQTGAHSVGDIQVKVVNDLWINFKSVMQATAQSIQDVYPFKNM